MKVQSKRKKPQANKIFTDREEPRESFWKNYRQYKELMQGEGEVKVLAYYGIGGIGKTTLLHKLENEMQEHIREPKHVYFDFNIAQDARTVLDYLKTKLAKDYGYVFPLYELGVYAYAQKIGEDMASPQIKGFIEKSPLLNFAVTAFGAIPVAGVLPHLLNVADKGIVLLRTRIEKHNHDIKDIANKTPDELYDYLPYLFAQDLANELADNTEPLVVFLDTYERLVNEMSSVGEPLNNDLWIRGGEGLIQNIPNVLWVIAGREKLKWERFDVEWSEALEQHILGNLSRTDADSFLKFAGIVDENLREGLYNLTKGTPVYLDLCVDRYVSLIEQGKEPVIADFGKNVYTLIERFARYMDDSRKDIVYMLSCMKIWNDIMVTDLGSKIIPGFSLTTYEKVKDFSFVTKSDKYNYNIHQTVGDTLFANCPQVIKDTVKKHVVPYCEEKLNESGTFDPVYIYHLQWLVRFGLLHYENEDEFIKFYNDHLKRHLKRLAVSGQALLTEHIFEPVMIRANKTGESLLKALALSESSFWKHKKGEFAVSVALAEESVKLYAKLLGDENEVTLKAKHRLGERLRANGDYQRSYDVLNGVLSIRKSLSVPMDEEEVDLRDDIASAMLLLGKYNQTLPLVEETLALREKLPQENKPSSYNTLWNLGEVYYYLGRYQESLPVREELCKKSENLLGKRHLETISSFRNLAISLSKLGKYKEALPLREQVLELRKEILGGKHPDTISAMQGLANELSNLGRYKEALQLREEVVVLRKEVLGEKHPDTIDSMNNLAVSYNLLGRYNEALPIREQVLSLRKEILGEKHPDTISAMQGLAIALSNVGRYNEALPIREQVLALRKEILGERHPDTISAMQGLSNTLNSLGRYEEDLLLQEQVLALRKEVLGEKHPDTISAMQGLSGTLNSLGRYEEDLLLQEQVLALRKEVLGEKHPDTISALQGLAGTLNSLGRYKEALPIREQVLALRREVLGEKHPDTISALQGLAGTLNLLGRYKEALPIREQVLALRKEILGEKHPNTISAMQGLAGTLNSLGRYKEALPIREQVLALRKEILGEKHPNTISAMQSLANSYSSLGKHKDELLLREQVLSLNRNILGEKHPDTIKAVWGLANSLSRLGRDKEALPLREQVLVSIREVLGEKHPDTIMSIYNLACSFSILGRYKEALSLEKKALELRCEVLGEKHPDTIMSMNGLAWNCFLSKRYQEGVLYAEKAVKLQEEINNIKEDSRINYLDTLALLYAETGNVNKALEIVKHNLDTVEVTYSSNQSLLASMNYSVAYCLNKDQKYLQALQYAERAYSIRKEKFGEANGRTIQAKELLEEIKEHI